MALEADAPFTVGVVGKWGSGKTSVMRRAFATLGGKPLTQKLAYKEDISEVTDEEWDKLLCSKRQKKLDWPLALCSQSKNTFCVWYSPWQYQNECNPLIGLVREIQAQFNVWQKAKSKAAEINRRGGLALAKLFEHVTDAALTYANDGKNVNLARGVTDAVRKGWHDAAPDLMPVSDGQRFHLLFQDIVEELLKGNSTKVPSNARLIIFIDDLDRCEEQVIVSLLEAIKLYLGTPYTVFILGLDDGAVMSALKNQWSHRSEDLNREYLEKLFQATLNVPLPQMEKVQQFIKQQLGNHNIPNAPELAQDIESLLEPNPRKIKNFVNGLCAAWNMLDAKSWCNTKDEQRQFVLFHYLRTYHRAVWRLLERQPETLKILRDVLVGGKETLTLEGIAAADQKMLRAFFVRAFSHVLPDDILDAKKELHLAQKLDDAIQDFIDRQDRKRSDEYVKFMFDQLTLSMALPATYLNLPDHD